MALNPLASIGIGLGSDVVSTLFQYLGNEESTADMENEQKSLAQQAISGLQSTYAQTVGQLNTTVQNNIQALINEFPAQANQIQNIYSASNPVIQADLQNLKATYEQNVNAIQQQVKQMHGNDIKNLADQFGNNGGSLSAHLLGFNNLNEMQANIASTTQMLQAAQPMQNLLGGIATEGMKAQGTALQENVNQQNQQRVLQTQGVTDLSKGLMSGTTDIYNNEATNIANIDKSAGAGKSPLSSIVGQAGSQFLNAGITGLINPAKDEPTTVKAPTANDNGGPTQK